jgi:tetratricopeptide (TPR) repeat protein
MKKTKLVAAAVGVMLVVGAGADLAAQSLKTANAFSAEDWDKAYALTKKDLAAKKYQSGCARNWPLWLLGVSSYQLKLYPEAIAAFQELFANAERAGCFQADSASYDATRYLSSWHYWLGLSHLAAGQSKEAAASLARAAELAPAALPPDQDVYLNRTYYIPTKGLVHAYLARAQFETGAYDAAAVSYGRAVEAFPKDIWLYVSLVRTRIALKRFDEALTAAKKAAEIDPGWTGQMALGEAHIARRQYGEAEAALKKAIELEPKRTELYEMLGRVHNETENYEAGIENFRKEADLVPANPYPLFWIGMFQKRLGRFDEALATYDKAIGLQTFTGLGMRLADGPGEPVLAKDGDGETGMADGPAKDAGLRPGDVLVKVDGKPTKDVPRDKVVQSLRGEAGTSVTVTVRRQGLAQPFDKMITRRRIVPKQTAPYFAQRGIVHLAKGDAAAALQDAEQGLALDPGQAAAREILASLDIAAGRYDAALAGLAANKDSSLSRLLEATAYAKKGEAARAVEIYAAIPEDELASRSAILRKARTELLSALQAYAQQVLDEARAAESAGRAADALRGYAAAILVSDDATAALIRQRAAILLKSDPTASELPEQARRFALRGDVLIKEGSFAEALAEYRSALRIAPLSPQLHFNTALIHGQLKSYQAAIRSMTVYLQLAPDAPNARAAKDEIYKWEFILEKEGKK